MQLFGVALQKVIEIEERYALLMRANKPKTAVQSSGPLSWHHMIFLSCNAQLPPIQKISSRLPSYG